MSCHASSCSPQAGHASVLADQTSPSAGPREFDGRAAVRGGRRCERDVLQADRAAVHLDERAEPRVGVLVERRRRELAPHALALLLGAPRVAPRGRRRRLAGGAQLRGRRGERPRPRPPRGGLRGVRRQQRELDVRDLP